MRSAHRAEEHVTVADEVSAQLMHGWRGVDLSMVEEIERLKWLQSSGLFGDNGYSSYFSLVEESVEPGWLGVYWRIWRRARARRRLDRRRLWPAAAVG